MLQSFERLCSYIAGEIRYTADPIADIFTRAAGETAFAPLQPFLNTFSAHKDWRALFQDGLQQHFGQLLQQEDITLICSFGEGLGSTDATGQLAHCQQYETRLHERAVAARQQVQMKGKLYTSLGVAGGLVITLLWL